MREATNDGQFAEILVVGNQDTYFVPRPGENVLIARVLRPIAGPDYIMTRRYQVAHGPAPEHTCRVEASRHGFRNWRLNSLVFDQAMGVGDARQHVGALQPRIAFE